MAEQVRAAEGVAELRRDLAAFAEQAAANAKIFAEGGHLAELAGLVGRLAKITEALVAAHEAAVEAERPRPKG